MHKSLAIIWSPLAEETYLNILEYLINNWSLDIALKFDNKVVTLINKLSKHNKLCPKSANKNLRKCVITRQISLIYGLTSNHIELVVFLDNRSQHNF